MKKKLFFTEEKTFIETQEKLGQLKCVTSSSQSGGGGGGNFSNDNSTRRNLPADDGFLLQCCAGLDGVLLSNDR